MSKVGIVIPSFNRASLLWECLPSVFEQSFSEYEVLLIDDGSTDNTRYVASAFPLKYYYQENQGVVAALNRGIKLCSSEYICFLGSDDVLLRNSLARRAEVMDAHPEVGFCYGQAYRIDEAGRLIGLKVRSSKATGIYSGRKEIEEILLTGNQIPASTVMVRAICLPNVGLFNPAFDGSEDLDMSIRLAMKYPVAYIAEPLAKHRFHRDSLTFRQSARRLDWADRTIMEQVFNDAELGPYLARFRRAFYFRHYLLVAGHACSRGEMKVSREYLFRAMRTLPSGCLRGWGLPWSMRLAKTFMPGISSRAGARD